MDWDSPRLPINLLKCCNDRLSPAREAVVDICKAVLRAGLGLERVLGHTELRNL